MRVVGRWMRVRVKALGDIIDRVLSSKLLVFAYSFETSRRQRLPV